MRLIIQKVHSAEVIVENKQFSGIPSGYVIYLCFNTTDTKELVDKFVNDFPKYKIFKDLEFDKLNFLIISNFRLCGIVNKSKATFHKSMKKNEAEILFKYFIDQMKMIAQNVETGCFGTYMIVNTSVDGPFNIICDIN